MKDKKRYVVTMDVYIQADNDYQARYKAHRMADKINAQVNEIGEQPFASFDYRKLDFHGPVEENLKDETLPF